MLLHLLALEYIMGEIAYFSFDFMFLGFDAFIFYFFALMAIDAFVCKWMVNKGTLRSLAYASLSIMSILVHIHGITTFIKQFDKEIYIHALEALFYAKLAVAVIPDVRQSLRHFIDSIRDRVVYSPSVIFATSIYGAYK